ncbi:MAG TPA: prepilin-type N-terminal cleavage/methylation domain-containing protein [Oceanospirillales bacterium]|nr:prepilin-type N-terminal cleavage/methylation domain-containing protein [Oceanospirillales bacterium]
MDKDMKNMQAYTLIELIMTLTIISLLISYALPNIYQLKLNYLMANERNRLTASLNLARFTAISKQLQVIICPSTSGRDCDNQSNWYGGWIIFHDDNRNRTLDQGEKLLRFEHAMVDEITATSSIHRQKLRFNSLGFSPGTNVSINFCDARGNDAAQAIIINNAGRVRQSKPIANNVCN